MHILHSTISLKFVLIPPNDNCIDTSVVSGFLHDIPVQELCHSDLYHLVLCSYAKSGNASLFFVCCLYQLFVTCSLYVKFISYLLLEISSLNVLLFFVEQSTFS